LETNGETFLMPKLSIVSPMMFLTFPTNTMITNGMNFLQYKT
jgi:alcohol dehydrogenase class IV